MAVSEATPLRAGTDLPRGATVSLVTRRHKPSAGVDVQLARGLGWFSIGLGLAELAAPRALARIVGVRDTVTNRTVLRAYGLREIAAGIGVLSRPKQPGWLWTRVAGDIFDLGTLAAGFASPGTGKGRLAFATTSVLGVTALDVYCARQLSEDARETARPHATESITVAKSPEEAYRFWRDFQNLPRVMRYLESVQPSGDGRSRWRAKGPGGYTVEWDAETTTDRPNEMIAWRSVDGSQIHTRGSVRFERAPGNRGTEVTVDMEWAPPGGTPAALVAKLFEYPPELQLRGDLRRFKQLLETGEIATSKGPSARKRPSIYGE